jgi:hypothetical protein
MGTRAVIGYQVKGEDNIVCSYCHSDGYLGRRGAGKALLTHCSDPVKAKKVAYNGAMNGVDHETGEPINWTGSDMSDPAIVIKSIDEVRKRIYCYYFYLYVHDTEKDTGEWKWIYYLGTAPKLKTLTMKDCDEE